MLLKMKINKNNSKKKRKQTKCWESGLFTNSYNFKMNGVGVVFSFNLLIGCICIVFSNYLNF